MKYKLNFLQNDKFTRQLAIKIVHFDFFSHVYTVVIIELLINIGQIWL